MKQIFVIIALIILTPYAQADCAATGVYVYPKSGEINQNSFIQIEGYYYSQEMVKKFGTEYKVKLVAEIDEVELRFVKRFAGMMDLTTMVFKPAELLQKNQTYTLVVEGLKKEDTNYPKFWNSATSKQETYQWKVTDSEDNIAPVWKSMPKHLENSQELFGCGPAIHATFEIEASDASPIYVQVELQNKSTNKTNSYLLAVEDQKVNIGHGMCSGAFTFIAGDDYNIRFKLYDLSGNESPNWSSWIDFENPAL